VRKPWIAESLRKNGYTVMINKEDGTVETYTVSPEEATQMGAKIDEYSRIYLEKARKKRYIRQKLLNIVTFKKSASAIKK
jgi:hypothetical protein